LNVLEGHEGVVNCIANHPAGSMFASSGIDHEVFLWQNTTDFPDENILTERQKKYQQFIQKNTEALIEPECNTQ